VVFSRGCLRAPRQGNTEQGQVSCLNGERGLSWCNGNRLASGRGDAGVGKCLGGVKLKRGHGPVSGSRLCFAGSGEK
jgi:hypothetical protein